MLERPWEYSKMARVENTLWWYRALHHLTLGSLKEHFGNRKDLTLVDAGCGTGGLLSYLKQHGYTEVSGFDLSPEAVDICKSLSLNVFREDLQNVSHRFGTEQADVIVSHDNFYFLSPVQRRAVTDDFYKILRPGGIVIMNLPALKVFAGIHDLSVGVVYRFSRSDIGNIFDEKKFVRRKVLYWPFLLSPVIFLERLIQKARIALQKAPEIKSDTEVPASWLNNLLFNLTKQENVWLPYKPWGSSLFLVMKKRGPAESV
jgi:SAM-dependent methyltransferase